MEYLYEKDLGDLVGKINQRKLRWSLSSDKRKEYDILKLSYWLNETENIEDAYSYYRISNIFKKYFVDDLLPDYFNKNNKENIKRIRDDLLTGEYKSIKKLEYYKSDTSWSVDFWIFGGWTYEESLKLVEEKQKNNSNKFKEKKKLNPENYRGILETQLEYWIKRGYSYKEAKLKLSERQSTFSKDKCIKIYGEEIGLEIFNQRQINWKRTLKSKSKKELDLINKKKSTTLDNFIMKYGKKQGRKRYYLMMVRRRRTGFENGTTKTLIEKSKYYNYSKLVWKHTNLSDLTLLYNYDNRGSKAYHLDHKISTKYGFENDIDYKIIGDINNLQMLPYKENLSKGSNCYSVIEYYKKGKIV